MAFTVDNPIITTDEAADPEAIDFEAQTLEAIQRATADQPIILDFDETLFLRNSTAEYLNSIHPKPLGAAYLLMAKAIRPWRWLPASLVNEDISMDWFLVVFATLLFPWTRLVWRRKAKRLAQSYWNGHLLCAIAHNPNAQVVVATLGFSWIVNPLLKHLPVELSQQFDRSVVACGFWRGAADRAKGKRAMVAEAIGEKALSQSVVVTDSNKDAPLLAAAEKPCLLKWPEAEYVSPMSDVYVPLFYSEKVKNPGRSHILKRVIMGHWVFLMIAFSFLSDHFLLNAAGLLLLTVSYWCIYEIGYWENDVVGDLYERKPMLSENYLRYRDRLNLNTAAPWIWAMALATPALVLLEASNLNAEALRAIALATQDWQTLAFNSAIWLGFLCAVRATFWMYNQFSEYTRIWIYPFLQTQKLFGFAMLVSTNAVGAVLLLSLAVSRWLHYSIYRCGGDRDRFPLNLCCLVLFAIGFSTATLSSLEPAVLLTWQSAAAFLYCLMRGIKGFRSVNGSVNLVQD